MSTDEETIRSATLPIVNTNMFYDCERCGSTGWQEDGKYYCLESKSYIRKSAGPCTLCDGLGHQGIKVKRTDAASELNGATIELVKKWALEQSYIISDLRTYMPPVTIEFYPTVNPYSITHIFWIDMMYVHAFDNFVDVDMHRFYSFHEHRKHESLQGAFELMPTTFDIADPEFLSNLGTHVAANEAALIKDALER
jgi:hypothetical protein